MLILWNFFVILMFSHLVLAVQVNYIENDMEELTNNLFDNLRGDPNLLGDVELSPTSKAFIDKQVDNYINLMLNSQESEYSRLKRSLPENETTSENYFIDIKPYKNVPTISPRDMVFFEQKNSWYAVCLETHSKEEYSHVLKIKKIQDDSFEEIDEVKITHGTMVAVFPWENITFIIVAENDTARQNYEEQTSIFRFIPDEKLHVIQRINTSYTSYITFWELENNIYMSVAQFMKRSRQEISYNVDTPIYKWYGGHFDAIQYIKTWGVVKTEPFSIGTAHFLAVANTMSDTGGGEVYSEILKYDVQSEKYTLFQRIRTNGCSDIKHFKVNLNREEEHFLIIANSQQGLYGNTNVTPSIFYKFVDNYFLPFQSIKTDRINQCEPVTVEGGDILLLAASASEGLLCYQYDGWHFVESKIQFRNKVTSRGIRAMHFYKFEDKTIVVIANENDKGNSSNIFEINYSAKNELQMIYNEMFTWCLENEKIVQETSDIEFLGIPLRGDMEINSSSSEEKDTNGILHKLKTYQILLDQVEDDLRNAFQSQSAHIIDSDLKVKQIILTNDNFLNAPQIETINNIQMDDLFGNVLNINEGFATHNTMEFDFLRTEEPIFPKEINNLPKDSIIYRNSSFDVDTLIVNGSLWFLSDQNNVENINNMTMDSNLVLLKSGDQKFDNLNADNVRFNQLETPDVNDVKMKSVESVVETKQLKELKAKKVVIGGYINNVDVQTLDRYALRISGNQVISKTYYFDSIEADNLENDTLSGKDAFNDFVPITAGTFLINKNVKFAKDLSVNNLIALNYLDSIPVKKGRLDVLERDSIESQYVPGIKSFENLELLNPIKLQGKIRSKDLDTMNPVVTIDSNLDLNGDRRITGNVIVEETVKSNDVLAGVGKNSLLRLRRHGVKLSDPEIPIHLRFSQHINVRRIFADKINNIEPDSWVVNGAKNTQIITGCKQFGGGLQITGDTSVVKMNGIVMEEFEKNVLQIDGDQVIVGKHYVEMAEAEKSIKSDDIIIGTHPWTNVVTTNTNQTIKGMTTFENLVSDNTLVGNLKTLGLVNNVNLSEIVGDVATNGSAFKIFSHKIFKNLTVDNLTVKDSDFVDRMISLENHRLNLKADVDFPTDTVAIKNIRFSGRCNGVKKGDFKLIPKDEEGVQVIKGDHEFDNITVNGVVYVYSNYISNVSFDDFVNKTIKIDEPFHFESITLNDIVVDDKVKLKGHVENLDLDNIFVNNKTEKQIIPDMKVFHGDVMVEGKVHFDGLFNNFNASDLCEFGTPNRKKKHLVIEGNTKFVKGPHVFDFNGHNVKELESRVWFNDQPTVIKGNVKFQDNVTFKDNVIVTGLVDGISLELLATNYLSKSKKQQVFAHMTFIEDVEFTDNIMTPKINLGGEVNGINIRKFIKTIFLHESQLFEESVYFQNLTATKLEGQYTVNKLSFESEVMRYDKPNQVTGLKTFKDLLIDDLLDDKNITIQDVNVLNWFKNSILTEGSFQISGKKYFKNVTIEKGVSVMGSLNGHSFTEDSILLRNLTQDVSGRKLFIRDTSEEIKFKALKVKGLVNNADIAERAHNQILKTGDNIFKSEIHFHNNVTAKNIDVKKLCQGVNVTQLLKNISNLDALNNFEDSYKKLTHMSREIEKSLQGQAYFLHYFRPVPYIPNARNIFGKSSDRGENVIMAFHFENGSNILNLFEWNEAQNLFTDTRGFSINMGPYPFYINKVNLGDKDYIFIENEVDPLLNEGHTHSGKLIHFNSNFTDFKYHPFFTKGTIFLTSFDLPTRHQYCLLFIYLDYEIDIVCDDPKDEFYLLQRITTEKSHTASVISINGTPYLTTMKMGVDDEESRISIWKLNNESSVFEIHQTIFEEPNSFTMISYNCGHYLAMAYGHLQNTMRLGRVAIRRFDEHTQEFISWQNINLKTPTHIEFAILPSQELVLYILSDNPTEPFNVYIYEGISGFSKKIVGSAIPQIANMNQFSINNKHFVVAQHYNDISIIEAVFKGEKLY